MSPFRKQNTSFLPSGEKAGAWLSALSEVNLVTFNVYKSKSARSEIGWMPVVW